jgi:hypothetical protein
MTPERELQLCSDVEAIADALTIVALRDSRQMGDEAAVLAATNRLRVRSATLTRLNEGVQR